MKQSEVEKRVYCAFTQAWTHPMTQAQFDVMENLADEMRKLNLVDYWKVVNFLKSELNRAQSKYN